ncbi:pallilysin-related adhesin [Treponema brennaborense]|uniref:Pallilysin beta barrel domain-containing protein n=1 Tax=Treponema brennaborense (strain DSM 12168 / CIP 105900 / DD5/3) TaxID=906968 RepID=F4LPY2_TREBD|nr:pallilysin-related adhesin [Treponema brennaborense]AEE16074.1 hypothetical protein Trebr_0632 [Treponema brennaborense DSM 12168]
MKRLIIVVFVIVAAVLAFFIATKDSASPNNAAVIRSKTVIPAAADGTAETAAEKSRYADETVLTSFIPLLGDETLINTLSIDFDGDGYDDQINAVKRISNPYITLLVGLYNPFQGQYVRTTEIHTEIIQTKTFSYTSMDITGEHKNALIYSGFAENGDSVMKIFLGGKNGGKFLLTEIGDFRSDGTIFIQQLDRYDSYEAAQTTGVSFPVWVYSSDSSQGGNSLDQLQTMYSWNPGQEKYVKSTETRVAGTKLTAKELARIQDGTVETFAHFLDGLWYKTSNTADGIRYVFFNFREKEIIFQFGDSQEVYTWVNSTLRRNGIYLSTVNGSVTNLTRRIDISLTGIDEIKIKNQDDVRMLIGENTLWDGQYKKQSAKNIPQKKQTEAQSAVEILEKTADWYIKGITHIVFENGTYSLPDETNTGSGKSGRTTVSYCSGQEFIQLRNADGSAFFGNEAYAVSAEKTKEGTVTAVILEPVTVTPVGLTKKDAAPIKLEAVKQ